MSGHPRNTGQMLPALRRQDPFRRAPVGRRRCPTKNAALFASRAAVTMASCYYVENGKPFLCDANGKTGHDSKPHALAPGDDPRVIAGDAA